MKYFSVKIPSEHNFRTTIAMQYSIDNTKYGVTILDRGLYDALLDESIVYECGTDYDPDYDDEENKVIKIITMKDLREMRDYYIKNLIHNVTN